MQLTLLLVRGLDFSRGLARMGRGRVCVGGYSYPQLIPTAKIVTSQSKSLINNCRDSKLQATYSLSLLY